jgi:hypothetical protein
LRATQPFRLIDQGSDTTLQAATAITKDFFK